MSGHRQRECPRIGVPFGQLASCGRARVPGRRLATRAPSQARARVRGRARGRTPASGSRFAIVASSAYVSLAQRATRSCGNARYGYQSAAATDDVVPALARRRRRARRAPASRRRTATERPTTPAPTTRVSTPASSARARAAGLGSRTFGRGRGRPRYGGTTSCAQRSLVDREADELDAEPASPVLGENVDVGEVRLRVPVGARSREADLGRRRR